ncbi:hypothetical protein [Mycobacteroides abscessus]|uniref:Uncharacterized protein n=1 Tax=Mycobacteroides abscessus subsp. bolletii CRM-0020 TaxID=1306401 RepID=A0A829HM23_9MYCO|nr:hypothetical protein [Mycobacteroides abscessus]EPQ20944.1 hypothetical protein J108_23880 [Mycobacteroides abscessus subsp. bolletii CRM-0020]
MSRTSYDRDLDLPPPPNRNLWGPSPDPNDVGDVDGNPEPDADAAPDPNEAGDSPEPNAGSAPVAPQQTSEKIGTTPVLIPVPVPLKERMDATYAHTLGFTGFKSKRDFQRAAFEHYCAHLEATYNKGNQYPLVGQRPA